MMRRECDEGFLKRTGFGKFYEGFIKWAGFGAMRENTN